MGTSPVIPATILVVALLVAVCFGATADEIRLPSSSSAAVGRPWECCDFVIKDPMTRPPRWRCNDVVDKCSADCHECEESLAGDGLVCLDWIFSLLEPPVCTPRPWDCCDFAVCTRAYIPDCQCGDTVESCPSNCKQCQLVGSDPPLYRCLDVFHGYPGPKCTPRISKSN